MAANLKIEKLQYLHSPQQLADFDEVLHGGANIKPPDSMVVEKFGNKAVLENYFR